MRLWGSCNRRRLALRLVLAAGACAFCLLAVELMLRILCAREQRHGVTLSQRLEQSRNSSLADAQGEVSLRGMVQACANSNIVYEAKPGLKGVFRGKPIALNRFGLRGAECEIEKPPGTFRIAGLGDSVMFGWGVDQDQYYLKVLEQKLNARPQPHPQYEVLNFALPGYNTTMEVAVFEEKALPFQPDLVIIQFVNNDFGVPHFMLAPPNPWTLEKSFLWDLISVRLGWRAPEEDLASDRLKGYSEEDKRRISKPYRHMVGIKGYVRAMEKLSQLAKERNIPVILLKGSYSPVQGQVLQYVTDTYGFQVLEIGPYTQRRMDELGYPKDDRARTLALRVAPGDHHPNALGHEIYADGLLQKLDEMGLLKQP